MTNRRCISCEMSQDESRFNGIWPKWCEDCRKDTDSNERRRFQSVFWNDGKELFYLRFSQPDPCPDSISIPDSNEGKRKMLDNIMEKIEKSIEFEKKQGSDATVEANIRQLKTYYSQAYIKKDCLD